MIATWQKVAAENQVFPLDHAFAGGRQVGRPPLRQHYDFWGKDIQLPALTQFSFIGGSFTLDADLDLAGARASGVVAAFGSHFGGWSLYLDKGRPTFTMRGPPSRTTSRSPRPAGSRQAEIAALSGSSAQATTASGRTWLTSDPLKITSAPIL